MTTIVANCSTCGEVHLTTDAIELFVCSSTLSASYYEFTCPVCHIEVKKPADERVMSLLISEGVLAHVFELPAELAEPHYGSAITLDEMLDFHNALDREDYLADIAY